MVTHTQGKVAEEEGIKLGEMVNVGVRKVKKSYFGAARGSGPVTTEDEMKPTTSYVEDAYARIEYLDGTPRGERVRDLLEDPRSSAVTSPVTLAEIVNKFLWKGLDPTVALKAIEDNSTILQVDTSLAKPAGELHAELRKKERDFGLADAFVLATARNKASKVLTGDPHFETAPETVLV